MSITPIEFATNIFELNGAPLQFPHHKMRHLYPIYNKPSSATLLKFGRQTHKSSTVGYRLLMPCLKYSNYHSLYIAPTEKQVSVFSTDKLDGAIRSSEIIKNRYLSTETKNQVLYKEFQNGSKIYLRPSFRSADSVRGISGDQMCIDEVQDIISDHIPVIQQCMGHSIAKWSLMKERVPNLPGHLFNSSIYAGTPKTVENTMEKFWNESTQNEWIIKCQHTGCKKYNYINENNIGDKCLICNKCGKPIHYRDGDWVAMNNSGFIDGYRLPQIVLDWINDESDPRPWEINVINTRKIYSAELYHNEILALPYAAAKHPIGVGDIVNCCQDYDMLPEDGSHDIEMLSRGVVTAGIDWGKGDMASGTSYSVLMIGAMYKGVYSIVFTKKYSGKMSEPLIQIEDMLRIINLFGVRLTIADTGDGRTSNAIMVNRLGPAKFAELYEHGSMKQKMKWDGDNGHYTINRTRVMTDLMMEIKKAQVHFYRHEEFKEYQPDFTGIYSEYSERTRMTRYDHIVPDDAFHAYMFSAIANKILRGEYSKYLTGGDNSSEKKGAISIG